MSNKEYMKRPFRAHQPLIPAGLLRSITNRILNDLTIKYDLSQHKSDKNKSDYFCWTEEYLFRFLMEVTGDSLGCQIQGFRTKTSRKRLKRRLKKKDAKSVHPTAQGLWTARQKFPAEIIQEACLMLSEALAPYLIRCFNSSVVPVIIDGMNIPVNPGKADKDLLVKAANEKERAAVHFNGALLAGTDFYFDCELQPGSKKDERKAAMDLIERITERMKPYLKGRKLLFIMDRGYFSYELAMACEQLGIYYLIRLTGMTFQSLSAGEGTDCEVDLAAGKILMDWRAAVEAGLTPKDLENLPDLPRKNVTDMNIKAVTENGGIFVFESRVVSCQINENAGKDQYEYLITNLPSDQYSLEYLRKQYSERWQIEVNNCLIKHGDGVLYLHSAKKNLVLQEVYSHLFQHNRAAVLLNRKGNARMYGKLLNQPKYKENLNLIQEWFQKPKKKSEELFLREIEYTDIDTKKEPDSKSVRKRRGAEPYQHRRR